MAICASLPANARVDAKPKVIVRQPLGGNKCEQSIAGRGEILLQGQVPDRKVRFAVDLSKFSAVRNLTDESLVRMRSEVWQDADA